MANNAQTSKADNSVHGISTGQELFRAYTFEPALAPDRRRRTLSRLCENRAWHIGEPDHTGMARHGQSTEHSRLFSLGHFWL